MSPITYNYPTTRDGKSQGENLSPSSETALVDKFSPGSDYSPAENAKLKIGNPANAYPDSSNYLESIAKSYIKCGGWAVLGECENGHQFAKEIFCGREWCPVCGKKESKVHKRRIARWLPKAIRIAEMGYLVITVPSEKRELLRDVKELRRFRRSIVRGLKWRGYARGLSRYHYFGNTYPGIFHPHLNMLLEAGYLSKVALDDIKTLVSNLLGCPVVVVHYAYTRNPRKMFHWLRYITRATFLNYEWDSEMADRLYHFNNTHCWGKWKEEPVWHIDEKEDSLHIISFLEKKTCPWCKTKIKWRGKWSDISHRWIYISRTADVYSQGYMHIGEGYWALAPPLDEWGNLPEIKYG